MPLAELYVLTQVADPLGWANTFGLLLVVSVFGAWMVRWQGLSVLGRLQERFAKGEAPTNELYNGGLVLFAGALLLTPGFITDAVGFTLLFPPSRALVRVWIQRQVKKRVAAGQIINFGPTRGSGFGRSGGFGGSSGSSGSWIDVDPESSDEPDPPELP